MRRLLTVVFLALLAPMAALAAPYSKNVMCDLGGLPANRTLANDVSLFYGFLSTGTTSVVPPGCDFGGLPSNAVAANDASLFVSAQTSVVYPLPANGFVDFSVTPPGGCVAGSPCDVTGTMTNVTRETIASPASGFANQRGELTVSVAYTNNTAGCTGPASVTPTGTLNNSAGLQAVVNLAASLNCPAGGSVDVTFFVPAGIESFATTVGLGTAEICPGPALCGAGAHLDSITITVPIAAPCDSDGVVEGSESCDEGAANGTPGSCCTAGCAFVAASTECRADAGACDVAETCTGAAGACPADGFEANGTACGGAPGTCEVQDTCTAGACTDNGFATAGTPCGDPDATGCNAADTCAGGSATCNANFDPAGTACGSASDTDCDNPDTCAGGSLTCNVNTEADGFSCGGAPATCHVQDTCTAGACTDNGFTANGTACDNGTNEPDSDSCQTGVCQDPPNAVVKLQLFSSGGGNASVDVVINTALPEVSANSNNLGGYDIEVTFDDTIADFACPSGLVQPGAPFNEPLLNQCVVTNPGTAAAKIRIADANTMRSATTGAVTVKRLSFTNVAGPQTLSVALTGADPDNLINYDAMTVSCGGACSTLGVSIP